jgi:hypothetical protein
MTGQTYTILVGTRLDTTWTTWFDGMTIQQQAEGVTSLTGYLVDQAALFGTLMKIRDLGLTLISVDTMGNEAKTNE